MNFTIKNFLFQKLKCSASRYFYQVLWQFLISGFRFGIFGQILTAFGGEMRPNYFHYPPHNRKSQICLARFGALGDQIVRNFRRKNQLAILLLEK